MDGREEEGVGKGIGIEAEEVAEAGELGTISGGRACN